MKTLCRSSLILLASSLLPLAAAAQSGSPQPAAQAPMAPMTDHGVPVNGQPLASPAELATVTIGGKAITIHYNSPRMRGREIMGKLVPYGQVWRTGANPATSFVSESALKVGTLMIPAGSYTLYTLPAAPGTPWMLIVNKQTGQWGTVYKQDMDLGRVPMLAGSPTKPQENMSISFEKTTKNTTQLHVKWETTDEFVTLEAVK
jgi:hypothetical protein